MAPPTAPDIGLERHRLRLELSLEKLRKALRHWQIFSAEYEAFREELQALPAGASREDMLAAGVGFGGTVVDEKEIKALLGDKMGIKRSLGQVITTVGHRISYVQENIAKVGKQIEHGQTRLASLLVLAAPDLADEDGLPIMDIREELDEEDNVVAATVNGSDPLAPVKAIDTEGLEKLVGIAEEEVQDPPPPPGLKAATQKPGNNPRNPSPLRKVITQDTPDAPKNPPVAISSATEDGGGLAKILDDAPEVPEKDWVQSVPGESGEDAELRREMLKYNMAEIGAVVAEINLDEDGDFYGYEDSDDYEDDDDDDDDDDGNEGGDYEDKYGRATYTVITPELQREMEELQRRVKERAEAARNGGAATESGETGKKGVRFAAELDIAPAPAPVPFSPSAAAAAPPARQTVTATESSPSFPVPPSALNEEDAIPLLLDLLAMDEIRKAGLQPALEKPDTRRPSIFKNARTGAAGSPAQERTVPASALAPTVLERSAAPTPARAPAAIPPRKPSRAAASIYTNTNNTTPHTPEDDTDSRQPTLFSEVTERTPSAAATPPDELDPSIHRREVASEFHRMRTKIIQQQGGFVESEEDGATVPLNEDGEKRKVSRFKAARLKMGQP